MFTRGLCALLVVFLATATRAATVRVACVGDSITFGSGIPDRDSASYPAVLGRLLGSDYEVRNFGVSGATLLKRGDRPYWSLDAFQAFAAFAPDLVVIKLGTNDSKPQNWKHADEFEDDLAAMIAHCRQLPSSPRIWIAKPVPVFRDRWGIRESIVRDEILPRLDRVASAEGVETIDLHRALRNAAAQFPDGVHPNAEGAAVLAQAVAAALRPALRSRVAKAPLHLVVLIADDMGWDDSGAYGHPSIRTPNIDRLAREGLRFDRAFLTTSSCSPSRASLLTGRYPHSTGAGELHRPLPAAQTLVAATLRDAGYHTVAAGKWHLGDAVKPQFDRILPPGGPSGTENWVRALEERPREKPLFAWLASIDPHRDYADDTIDSPHTPADAVVPRYLPDTEAVRRDLARYYDEVARLDAGVGRVLDEIERQDLSSQTCVVFLSDNGRPFPRAKTTLYDDGVRTPFLVRLPGVVAAGGVTRSVVSAVDLAPTLLELAGLRPSPRHQGASFAAILLDPQADPRRYAFAEHNWHDYQALERAVHDRDHAYIWNGCPELARTPPADAVRSPTHRVLQELEAKGALPPGQRDPFVRPRRVEELFDRRHDPANERDLSAEPAYRAALQQAREALGAWRRATADAPDVGSLRPDEFDRDTGLPAR